MLLTELRDYHFSTQQKPFSSTQRSAVAYRKPTLIETYAELYLSRGTLTEARFFDVVPQLKKAGFTEIELTTVGLSLDIKQGRPSPRENQRVRCWKPGRTELVQVGEDLLVVNLTGEYPGWDSFVRLFAEARNALGSGIGELQITSLNLGALDQFDVPGNGFLVSEYLNVGGPIIPSWYSGCRESLDLDMGYGILDQDGHNRQIHVNVRAAGDPVRIGFRCQFHDRVDHDTELISLLSRLHDESNRTFEALITDEVRNNIMGGRKL